MFGLKVIVF
uniref:Uncharacterized protein n=1 Tax=Rhizophora mucronata TaxID=61149 RepID=A0A2P2P631_RHIMU